MSNTIATLSARRLEPHHFGPLSDEPVTDTGTHDLFPGEDHLLSKGARKKIRKQYDAVEAHLARVLHDDERVVWVAEAQQVPGLLEIIALGAWFYHMHRTTLVLTDRRLIEVLMDLRGKNPGTRIRSWGWSCLDTMKYGFAKLKIRAGGKRTAAWKIARRHDRKLLKKLLPRVREMAPAAARATADQDYRWMCPKCGASNEPEPGACGKCHTGFRTPRQATTLALAFPGAGLFYARRPILGTIDCIGEMFLFLIIAMSLMLSPSRAEAMQTIVLGLVLFALTKLESVHLSRMLVRRALPETQDRGALWRRTGMIGGSLSGVAMATAVLATGVLATAPQQDLTFDAAVSGWRQDTEFEFLLDDMNQRSQWSRDDGTTVFVAAYPLGPEESWSTFQPAYLNNLSSVGYVPTLVDAAVPDGFDGFRYNVSVADDTGTVYVGLNYVIWDSHSDAVHHVYTYVPAEDAEGVSLEFDQFVETATWSSPLEGEG